MHEEIVMSIAESVRDYLGREGVPYDTITHQHTRDSNHSAQAAHVPGDRVAKCVILEDTGGYLMAVLPATHKLDIDAIDLHLNRKLALAASYELPELFKDCEIGALPPLGQVYGFDTIVDECLTRATDVYFEAGEHLTLIHVKGEHFLRLMAGAVRGKISHHM
jgi:Ala-tRNA(Pro) deacylase